MLFYVTVKYSWVTRILFWCCRRNKDENETEKTRQYYRNRTQTRIISDRLRELEELRDYHF